MLRSFIKKGKIKLLLERYSRGKRVSKNMKKTQTRKRSSKRKVLQHRASIVLIIAVLIVLIGVLSVGSINLVKKMRAQDEQIAELEKQKAEEEERKEELEEKEEYQSSDRYIEDVARDKGWAYENEILLKPEQ